MIDTLEICGKQIKMSYARLNYIAGLIGDIDKIPAIYVLPELQEKVVKGFLASYVVDGDARYYDSEKPLIPVDELSAEDALKIIDFVEEHETDFFTKAVKSLEAKADRRKAENQTSSDNTPSGQKN